MGPVVFISLFYTNDSPLRMESELSYEMKGIASLQPNILGAPRQFILLTALTFPSHASTVA